MRFGFGFGLGSRLIGTNTRSVQWVLLLTLCAACATSPLGRRQLILMPDTQLESMGVQAFSQMKQSQKISGDTNATRYVGCVTEAITAVLGREQGGAGWEVVVFEEDSANAFALPGRKIGVHTGLLRVARTPDQLASVIGHEVGHVLGRHGNERVSAQLGSQAVLTSTQILGAIGNPASRNHQLLMSALGVGSQLGQLAYGRSHESEADVIGLNLMADAGFDPRESVKLWDNMERAAGGAQPPEFLSTHPAYDTRRANLYDNMEEALQRFRASNRTPNCRP